MKPNSRIQQFCAFSLLLVFSIQAGLGLWLHQALHQHPAKSVTNSKSTSPVVQQGAIVVIACTCTDDFLVPFIAVEDTKILSPFQAFFTRLAPANYHNVTCALHVFRPLRAPPVLTV